MAVDSWFSESWQRTKVAGCRNLNVVSCHLFSVVNFIVSLRTNKRDCHHQASFSVCGCTVCLVWFRPCNVFCGPEETYLVKDNGLPDNEQIASSHIWLSLSTVIELAPISVTITLFPPCCELKLHYFNSICSTLEFSDWKYEDYIPPFMSFHKPLYTN